MAEDIAITIPSKVIDELFDTLDMIADPVVVYDEDQLRMANQAIRMMRSNIETLKLQLSPFIKDD